MTVDPDVFVAAMSERWLSFGNALSEPLKRTWHQIAHTFNEAIASPAGETKWRVLSPATGSGKSQGLAVYSALLPEETGVLIVTRLKRQASELATAINELAGKQIAVAHHSDTDTKPAALAGFAVLVITHKSFENGLDAITKGQEGVSNWSAFMRWRADRRRLVVVDEALDVVEAASVTLDQVRLLLALIPATVEQKFPNQLAAIRLLETLLKSIAVKVAETPTLAHEKQLVAKRIPLPPSSDFTELRTELRRLRYDLKLDMRDDPTLRASHARRFDGILKGVALTLDNWNWYSRTKSEHTINTARLRVPEDAPSIVLLDATASSDLVYQLFTPRVELIRCPEGARHYGNVTLHVSMNHKVGKGSLLKNAAEESANLLSTLEDTLGTERKVFVACHRDVRPSLLTYRPKFAAFDCGTWNAIDGRNDWQDYDVAVVFGLLFKDAAWSAGVVQAFLGPQTTEWLRADGDRPFGPYKDVRRELEIGSLVVSTVQAINRVRCRRVINEHGDCLPTDVFILLPQGEMGKRILDGIAKQMPGIKIVDWQYGHSKRRVRKSDYEEALVAAAETMRPGRRSVSAVKSDLGISKSAWEHLAAKLKDGGDGLSQRIAAAGCRYEVTGAGSAKRAFLVKA